MNKFMEEAIKEARIGITNGHGGPFGAVIVKDGIIIGRGHNEVLKNQNATCHGEMMAIKEASNKLGTFNLAGCEIYTTGEPCHMCLCACMWANIDRVYYGCTIKDNDMIGFRDDKFDQIFGGREKLEDYLVMVDRDECLKLFEDYQQMNSERY